MLNFTQVILTLILKYLKTHLHIFFFTEIKNLNLNKIKYSNQE